MTQNSLPAARCALRKEHRAFAIPLIVFLFAVVCGKAFALDEFQGLQCGSDIPKSLIGKRFSNEGLAVLQERHKNLQLNDLGGTEISDRLFLTSWQICGSEYELLLNTKTDVIRDVLAFPAHSKTSPMYIGRCQAGGKEIPQAILAVLDNSAGYNARSRKLAGNMLKATAAWKIDEANAKFIKQPTGNLRCPLGGIVTQDGGP